MCVITYVKKEDRHKDLCIKYLNKKKLYIKMEIKKEVWSIHQDRNLEIKKVIFNLNTPVCSALENCQLGHF